MSPEADAPEDGGNAPEPGEGPLCPDGSIPRDPLPNPSRVAVANADGGELVAFNLYELGDSAAADAMVNLFGAGKDEMSAVGDI